MGHRIQDFNNTHTRWGFLVKFRKRKWLKLTSNQWGLVSELSLVTLRYWCISKPRSHKQVSFLHNHKSDIRHYNILYLQPYLGLQVFYKISNSMDFTIYYFSRNKACIQYKLKPSMRYININMGFIKIFDIFWHVALEVVKFRKEKLKKAVCFTMNSNYCLGIYSIL